MYNKVKAANSKVNPQLGSEPEVIKKLVIPLMGSEP
jgi:hypothetical protein